MKTKRYNAFFGFLTSLDFRVAPLLPDCTEFFQVLTGDRAKHLGPAGIIQLG